MSKSDAREPRIGQFPCHFALFDITLLIGRGGDPRFLSYPLAQFTAGTGLAQPTCHEL
jgi:hypothetical protein